MKKYLILLSSKKINGQMTITAQDLTDAINQAKNKVDKDFGKNSSNEFDFKPEPTTSGIVIY
jgi:hypothetical protein